MSAETELLKTLGIYAEAYCAKDTDRLMDLFEDGDDISIIGTGADELCAGKKQIRSLFERNFAEATAERFEWHWSQATVREAAAVIATTLTIHLDVAGEKIQVPIRWTVGLAKIGGNWKWLHRHASSAAGGQATGTAYPTN